MKDGEGEHEPLKAAEPEGFQQYFGDFEPFSLTAERLIVVAEAGPSL